MAVTINTFAAWRFLLPLLLVAALLVGAGADDVTIEQCRAHGRSERVRQYPVDSQATKLWLYGCNITNINPVDLANLPNVKWIALFANDIVHINSRTFRSVFRLTRLELQYNKLRVPPVFDKGSCPSLTELSLHHNLLTSIHNAASFSACLKVEEIVLSNNQIQYIHPDTFRALTELKYLYLQSNEIYFIPDQLFASNSKLMQLELFDNRLTYLPLDFVTTMKQAGVRLQYFSFDSNPWHCACLLELLADVKRAGVTDYNLNVFTSITHYDGTLIECNYIGRYPCLRPAPSGLLRPIHRT